MILDFYIQRDKSLLMSDNLKILLIIFKALLYNSLYSSKLKFIENILIDYNYLKSWTSGLFKSI